MAVEVLDTPASFEWESWQSARAAEHAVGSRTVWLFNNQMVPVCSMSGFLQGSYGDKANAAGALNITLPGDHAAVPTLLMADAAGALDPNALLTEWFWIVVETAHYRVTYRLAELELIQTDTVSSVTVLGEGLFEHLNHMPLWASPGSALLAQLKYADVRWGDSLRVIKQFLHVNLAREFQSTILTWWDMWSPTTWARIREADWPIMVNPVHESLTTEWTVLDSRFNMAGETFASTLDAAGLLVTVELWLPGDEQPAPDHVTLSKPTIWIDVVPRAFDSSSTGRPTDIIRGIRATISGDQTTKALVLDDSWFDGENEHAWCVWSADHMHGTEHRLIIRKSTDSHVIVGGRSPQIVNSLIAAGSNALWQGIGAGVAMLFPPLAPLAIAAGAFIGHVQGELLKDKLFAWAQYSSRSRALAHGPYRYRGIVTPGDGASLSSLQAGFTGLQSTQGSVGTEFTVGDGQPYVLGRDYIAGDQAAVISHSIVFATYVAEWDVTVTPDGDDVALGLGDPRLRESPARSLERSVQTLSSAIDRVKTAIP
ncbi:Gp37-like protein [Corynebacterium sp. AOP40-9SA-29]|uniref:Gp37-like protein n=1 Tax=Corynebacterium sp. AOP40-9SA-29 TaxID=3457677 RepID=UPI0040348077